MTETVFVSGFWFWSLIRHSDFWFRISPGYHFRVPLPRLYIVRHGNTDWAEAHRFTGRTDLPLNAREDNARRLAAVSPA